MTRSMLERIRLVTSVRSSRSVPSAWAAARMTPVNLTDRRHTRADPRGLDGGAVGPGAHLWGRGVRFALTVGRSGVKWGAVEERDALSVLRGGVRCFSAPTRP